MRARIGWRIVSLLFAYFVLTAVWAGSAQAATCWCSATCTMANGNTADVSADWDGFSRASSNDWGTCKEKCSKQVSDQNLQAMAKSKGVCGKVECTSNYYIGKADARPGISRSQDVECPNPDGGGGTKPPPKDFQYATKIVCGAATQSDIISHGDYRTVVNVHNPLEKTVVYIRKVALAALVNGEMISGFTTAPIGPDGTVALTCKDFRAMSGQATGLIDGYFVIQSKTELDVVGYYTGGTGALGVSTLHLDRVPYRPVAQRDFLCRKSPPIDLSKPQSWVMANGNHPYAIANSAWDPNRAWMSYDPNAAGIPAGAYTYAVDFCSCSEEDMAEVTFNMKGDNGALGVLNIAGVQPLFTSPSNFAAGALPVATGLGFFGTGTGSVLITVTNDGGPSGLSVIGTLTLPDGHLGKCVY